MLDVLELLDQAIPDETEAESKEEVTDEFNNANAWTHDKSGNEADPELEDMQRDVDLLSLIQQDTGESGSGSGDTIYFKSCPICGHKDCFRFHPSTNMWECWGGSNPNKNAKGDAVEVGAFLRYVLRTGKASDNIEAVKMLREATGNEYQRKESADSKADSKTKADLLPMWEPCRSCNPRKETPELIHSLFRKQHVGIIAAKGKGSKTWGALRLAIEVTQGGAIAGYQCESGRVLFIDAEMGVAAIDNRVARICDSLGYDKADVDSRLTVWSVEGYTVADRAPNVDDLLNSIVARGATFDLVVIDSCSNFLPKGADENSNPDVSAFYAKCRKIAQVTGASIWLVHHFGKGAQGDREAADMLRGASAWLDRPSLALVMCEIVPPKGETKDFLTDGERAFQIECVGMRSFEWPEPIHVIWAYPIHRIDGKGITKGWAPKSSQRSASKAAAECKEAKARAKAAQIEGAALGYFYTHATGEDGVLAPELAKELSKSLGFEVTSKTLKESCDGSKWLALYKKSARKHYIVPVHGIGSAEETQLPIDP